MTKKIKLYHITVKRRLTNETVLNTRVHGFSVNFVKAMALRHYPAKKYVIKIKLIK